jgi:glycosyltransferase involved in cell wall biosynthesis
LYHKLSILVPCYNEKDHILSTLQALISCHLQFDLEKEIIVVDDHSTDGTYEHTQEFAQCAPVPIKIVRHEVNSGKGACIQTGLQYITGEIVVIQDADLEYHPKDFHLLLAPIIHGYADVVYGSRFMGNGPHRVLFYFHTLGNKFLTFLNNLFTQLNLTDMETGYKMFKTEILKRINLKEKRFGFEPEVTARISRISGIRIYETGVSYYGRTYKEGKKINWKDGFRAIYCILKYNLFDRR